MEEESKEQNGRLSSVEKMFLLSSRLALPRVLVNITPGHGALMHMECRPSQQQEALGCYQLAKLTVKDLIGLV